MGTGQSTTLAYAPSNCLTTNTQHKKHKYKNLATCGNDGQLLLSGCQLFVTLTLTLNQVIRHTVVRHSSTCIYIPNLNEIGKKVFSWTD